jgi:hypothetical protein
MHLQLWGYNLEDKLYLGVREQKRLNTTALDYSHEDSPHIGITMNMYSVWILVTKRNTSDDGLI